MSENFRIERDSMGELRVPADALYAAQTQRAVDNFPISGLRLPEKFIHALALIKRCAAGVNLDLGLLDPVIAEGIRGAALEIMEGRHSGQFPVDVFQTGSATSTNMNVNEVIATLASRQCGRAVSPNDHVNMGQSSNDVIPTAIHVSAALAVNERLIPALEHLAATIRYKGQSVAEVVKTGRTHLMDAMPIRMQQEPACSRNSKGGQARSTMESRGCGLLYLASTGWPRGARRSAPESTRTRNSGRASPRPWPMRRGFRSSRTYPTSRV